MLLLLLLVVEKLHQVCVLLGHELVVREAVLHAQVLPGLAEEVLLLLLLLLRPMLLHVGRCMLLLLLL